MQVAPPGGHYMLAKFGTNAGGATWWSNFELIQVELITQVYGLNFWVRCASGNVFHMGLRFSLYVVSPYKLDLRSDLRNGGSLR